MFSLCENSSGALRRSSNFDLLADYTSLMLQGFGTSASIEAIMIAVVAYEYLCTGKACVIENCILNHFLPEAKYLHIISVVLFSKAWIALHPFCLVRQT